MSPRYSLPLHQSSNNWHVSHGRRPRDGQSTLSVHFPSNDDASLVTSIHTRPYTLHQDIPHLYYTASDIAEFKADYKHYKRTTRNRNRNSLFWMRRRMISSSSNNNEGDVSDSDHGAFVYSSLAVAIGAPVRYETSSCSEEYYDYDADDESLIAAISDDDEDDSMDSVENEPSLNGEKNISTAYETTTSTYQHESYYQEGESILNAVFDLAMDLVASVSKQGSLLSRTVVGYRDQNSRCLQEEVNADQLRKTTVPPSSSQQQFTSTMQLVDTLYLLTDI